MGSKVNWGLYVCRRCRDAHRRHSNDGTRTFHQQRLKRQQSAAVSGARIRRSLMTSASVLLHESKPSLLMLTRGTHGPPDSQAGRKSDETQRKQRVTDNLRQLLQGHSTPKPGKTQPH
ncbi:hypothetical protein AOLI_G00182970 [Acnodon oligacanthus]